MLRKAEVVPELAASLPAPEADAERKAEEEEEGDPSEPVPKVTVT